MIKLNLRGAIAIAICLLVVFAVSAQDPTPIVVQLATSTPLPILGASTQAVLTQIPTETTATGPQLEALDSVNVRAEASTDADRLGLIIPGERYTITGRYFRWLQFRYPNSPSGSGWVYDELVQVFGDSALIPDLSVAPPTADPLIAGATLTADAIISVPGGELTATANARILDGPVAVEAGSTPQTESELNPEGVARLPTFTPAPNIGELVSQATRIPPVTAEPALINLTREGGGVPPVLPIAALLGFGILGLAISFIRR